MIFRNRNWWLFHLIGNSLTIGNFIALAMLRTTVYSSQIDTYFVLSTCGMSLSIMGTIAYALVDADQRRKQSQQQPPPQNVCDVCGLIPNQNPQRARFCRKCGRAFTVEAMNWPRPVRIPK